MKKEEKEINNENIVEDVIMRHVYWSVGSGLIPIPIADIAAVTAVQLDMLKQICTAFDIDYSEENGKAWISALVTSSMSAFVARLGSSALKIVPLVGSIAGSASMAIVSGASTYALGQAFAKHFAKGGSLKDINKEKIKAIYQEKFKEGKTIAGKLKEKYLKVLETPEGKEKERNMGRRLKDLEDMKKEKLITEAEYKKTRQKIIKDLMEEG